MNTDPSNHRFKIVTIIIIVTAILMAMSLFVSDVKAQSTNCPPPGEQLCFGGSYFPIDIHTEVQIFFDTNDPYNVEQCTVVFENNTYVVPVTILKVKQKKYNYKVVAILDHPRLDLYRFTFFFSRF